MEYPWRAAPRDIANILEYALFRTGPLSSNVFESTGFIRTSPQLSRPDVQIVFQAARRNRGRFPFPLGHGYAINIVGLYPKSRGQVQLANADPLAAPLVDPQLLSHSDDVATLLRGFKLGRQISRAPSFARYHAHEAQPGTAAQDDAALVDYIRRAASTVHHPVRILSHGQRCRMPWSIRSCEFMESKDCEWPMLRSFRASSAATPMRQS